MDYINNGMMKKETDSKISWKRGFVMSTCKLDHNLEDVKRKLSDLKLFLPGDLFVDSSQMLEQEQNQQTLNEMFHLLKKYDLATEVERNERNDKLRKLTSTK